MSSRVSVNAADPATLTCRTELLRGVVGVGDVVLQRVSWAFGTGLLCWEFALPSVIPASGAWTLSCPQLAYLRAQCVGSAFVGQSSAVAYLDGGIITLGALAPAANSKLYLKGMVNV